MKTHPSRRSPLHRLACLAVLAAGLPATHAAPPSLQPLLPGRWAAGPRGYAYDVKVAGHYAYVAFGLAGLVVIDASHPAHPVRVGGLETSGDVGASGVAVSGNHAYVADQSAGLQVIDVSDPAHCVRVGGYVTDDYAISVALSGHYACVASASTGLQVIDVSAPSHCVRAGSYDTGGFAWDVAVAGHHAYVTDFETGLHIIDVSHPTNCVRVGGHATDATARGVAVVANRIYLANGEAGLVVLPTLPNVQFTVRVDAAPGVPFTLEAATSLNAPIAWTPLLTTNVATMPFDYVDFDVKQSGKPQKFYRVRQP